MDICYDEIVFGKTVAGVHVGGTASNAYVDVEKEVPRYSIHEA